MSDPSKTTRLRSPPFPAFPLQKAIERTEQLYRQEREHFAPITSAAKAWDMSPTSSSPIQTIGTLRQYGLIEDEGSGDTRRVKITRDALQILLDKLPTSIERRAAIRRCMFAPKIFAEIASRWTGELPSDQTVVRYLTLERRLNNQSPFSEQAAIELLANYRASLPFAGMDEDLSISSTTNESREIAGMDTHSVQGAQADLRAQQHNHIAHRSDDPVGSHNAQKTGPHRASSAYAGTDGDLNVLLTGGRLEISANVDLAGVGRLKEVLGHYEQILKLLAPTDPKD